MLPRAIPADRVGSPSNRFGSGRFCANDRIANGIASLTTGHGQRQTKPLDSTSGGLHLLGGAVRLGWLVVTGPAKSPLSCEIGGPQDLTVACLRGITSAAAALVPL